MVIVAAAAVTAAAYGTYKGGKHAIEKTKESLGNRKERRERQQERQEQVKSREADKMSVQSMSFEDRLAKYKKESGLPSSKKATASKGPLGRFRKK